MWIDTRGVAGPDPPGGRALVFDHEITTSARSRDHGFLHGKMAPSRAAARGLIRALAARDRPVIRDENGAAKRAASALSRLAVITAGARPHDAAFGGVRGSVALR